MTVGAWRYGCGCRIEASRAYPGSRLMVPCCMTHGSGFSLVAVARLQAITWFRHAWFAVFPRISR